MEHELKTWPADFEAIEAGRKTHEARKADRPFAVGDTLRLREWVPSQPVQCDWKESGLGGHYTGRQVVVSVTHLTRGEYGLPGDLAIMSIRPTLLCFHSADATRP